MESDTRDRLIQLIESGTHAAFGTLYEGAPYVSMVLYASSPDMSSFFVHISSLAAHTRNIFADPRVGLMISESDDTGRDPQTLARVSIQGRAVEIKSGDNEFESKRSAFLKKNPQAERNFNLGDFRLFEIQVNNARFVGGFGRILDLSPEDLQRAAGSMKPSEMT